jgi:DNA polymerase I-like protein with 3'-5' exonuclease and polymerase domains
LVKPPDGTESKASNGLSDRELSLLNSERLAAGKTKIHRVFSTAAPILSRIKARGRGKQIIELLLRRAELEKLDSTYYTGLIEKAKEMEWDGDELHGQFNTCVAQTGRLSSSNPNLQNFSGEIKELFYSRYE